jgi:hypothetical protein
MKPRIQTRTLLAVKPHRYGTRHLTAGEEYEAPLRDAVALVVGRKARFQAQRKEAAASPVRSNPPAIEAQSDSIEALRTQARALGIEVDGRWGTARLQYEIGKQRDEP